MSRAKAGKSSRQKDAQTSRQTKGRGERENSKPVPASNDPTGALGGDPSRRAATHLIPEKQRRPGAFDADPRKLSNVPVNETPPPHVLDPEGHAERLTKERQEFRKATRKRNADIAKAEDDTTAAGAIAPRFARTSRDRAIIEGTDYDNSQAGDFRDSSQKDGAPEERYIRPTQGKVGEHPVIAAGKTAQQANDLQRPEASTASTEASEEKEEREKGDKKKKK